MDKLNHFNLLSNQFSVLLTVVLLFSSQFVSAKLYKWVDENGKVYYSDKIPPKANKRSHSLLNDKGITVESRQAAKTKEQIKKEHELEELRKQKELVIKKQEAKDRVLLKTFRSEDDLILARDGKIRSIDNLIGITKGNIKRFKSKLSIMQGQAADLEKSGQAISKKFTDDIEQIKRQINQGYASIVAREQVKEEIRLSYNTDIARFRILKKLSANSSIDTDNDSAAELNTVYICPDKPSCEIAWNKAIDYVKKYATTKLQLIGERIYMTRAPSTDKDISLTVALIKDKETSVEKIFLDQQCRTSIISEEFCKSDVILDIKRNFIPTISTSPSIK